MMTSNRPLEEWGKLIGDVPSATAILDRFLHRSELVQITGKSYRLENSQKSSKGTKAPTGPHPITNLPKGTNLQTNHHQSKTGTF